MDTSIRGFVWEDLDQFTPLFNDMKGIAGTDMELDAEVMRQMLSHPSCAADRNGFVAESNGNLVGFALISPEFRIGRAVMTGGVLTPHRRKGTGGRLVRAAIEHSLSIGVSVIHTQAPEESAAGRAVLEREGFRVVRRYWDMKWGGGDIPALNLAPGFSIRSFSLGADEELLTKVQNSAFSESWGFCPNTIEEIAARVRFKGFDPSGILFVMDGERPSGYNWTSRSSNHKSASGRIEMTGVLPAYRRRGLGRTIVVAGMASLRSKGVESIDLEVDSANVSAIHMYRSLGFHRLRQTLWFELQLPRRH